MFGKNWRLKSWRSRCWGLHLRVRSQAPGAKLKDAYLTTVHFLRSSSHCFVFIFFQTHEVLVKSLMALVIVAYIFFFVINISMFSRIQTPLPVEQKSSRSPAAYAYVYLRQHSLSGAGGTLYISGSWSSRIFLGGSHGTNDFGGFLEHKSIYVIPVITLAVLTPLCFYLTRWMYKISYGKCLKELKPL